MEQQIEEGSPIVELKKSGIHGTGLFALEDIKKGQKIVEYKGEVISAEEGDRRSLGPPENPYILILDDEHDVDGNVPYNDARFINHSCNPNSDCETINGRMWFVALKDIRKGEEITFDYALDSDELISCGCRSEKCKGYINHPDDVPRLKKETFGPEG